MSDAINRSRIGRRILVVDDDLDSAESLAMLFQMMGHDVRAAHDGLAAVEQADVFRPDLIVLDIGMPGIDGYETCRRIRRALGRGIKLIAMTGWGQERDKQEAKRAGFDAHLTKPVDPAMLKGLLAEPAPAL